MALLFAIKILFNFTIEADKRAASERSQADLIEEELQEQTAAENLKIPDLSKMVEY